MLEKRRKRNRLQAFRERQEALTRHSIFGDIIGGLFGGKSKQEQSERQERDETRRSVGTRVRDVEDEQETVTTLLGGDVRAVLEDLVIGLGQTDETASSRVGGVADVLLERALGAEETIERDASQILDAARFRGEREIEALTANLSRAAGAGPASNSFVAGATAEALAGLEIGLGELEATIAQTARDTQTNELAQTAQVLSSEAAAGATESSAIAQLADILRGAQSTQRQTGTQRAAEEFTAEEIINAIITGESVTKGKTREPILEVLSGFD